MNISTLCKEVRVQIATFQTESDAYAAQIERGNDLFENSRAQSFSDGASEALGTVLKQLEDLREIQASALEWGDDSASEPWGSGSVM